MHKLPRKILAGWLIATLIFPLLAEAQTNYSLNVTTNPPGRSASPTTNLTGQSTNNNVNSVAPRFNALSTLTTPSLLLNGPKKEGSDIVLVSRYGESGIANLNHDATPPKCPPAPTEAEYDGGTDYYTSNGLQNPWPPGLNGEWVTSPIEFFDNNPLLCRDQIQDEINFPTNPKLFVESVCSPAIYYHEDQADCSLPPTTAPSLKQTLPGYQMAGCPVGSITKLSLGAYGDVVNFSMHDNVLNYTTSPHCPSPAARIDCLAPEILNLEVEHAGLGLAKEPLSNDNAAPNQFRADDGSLFLYADFIEQNASGSCGRSGLNWEALQNRTPILNAQFNIAIAENQLDALQQSIYSREADLIIARTNVMTDLLTQLNQKVLNNLWAETTGPLLANNNFIRREFGNLTSGASSLQSTTLNAGTLNSIIGLLNGAQFSSLPNQSTLVNNLSALNPAQINQSLSTYQTALPQALGKINISPLATTQSLSVEENDFLTFYNQWQIDKNQNYSHVYPSWLTVFNNTENFLNTEYSLYQARKAAHQSNDLHTAAGHLDPFFSGATTQDMLLDIRTEATNHASEQNNALNRITTANNQLAQTLRYLQNFRSGDVFDNNQITQLVNAIRNARDAAITLNGDLDSGGGALGLPLEDFLTTMRSSEAQGIISNREAYIRTLANQVDDKKVTLQNLENAVATDQAAASSLAAQITNDKAQLAALIEAQANASSVDFLVDKITHLEIERLGGSQPNLDQFFPPSTTPFNGNTYRWDLNLFKFANETNPIFTVAGAYRVTLRGYDQAGNQQEATGYIDINPAELVPRVSFDNCNDGASQRFADLQDSCHIEIEHLDAFGNLIDNTSNLEVTVRDQSVSGSYDLVAQQGRNYQNGIRFVETAHNPVQNTRFSGDKHRYRWQPGNRTRYPVYIRTMLPTIEVLTLQDDPSLAVGFAARSGFDLPLVFTFPQVDERGNLITSPGGTANFDLQMNFLPWLNVQLSDRSGPPSSGPWTIGIDSPFPVFAQASTGSPTKNLPTNFDVNLLGVIDSNFSFQNEDLSAPGKNLAFRGVNASSAESGAPGLPATPQTTIVAQSALATLNQLAPFFIPTARYRVNDVLGAGPKTITVPGAPLGASPVSAPVPSILPTVNISNGVATEGENVIFNVSLDRPAEETITLYFRINDLDTDSQDYIFNPNQAYIINPSQTSVSVNINTVADGLIENDETFTLAVENYVGNLDDATDTGTGTITDNDNSITLSNTSATEGQACQIGIQLGRPTDQAVDISLSLGLPLDSATPGTDYDASPISATIPAGSTSTLVSVPTIEDSLQEPLEFFTAQIQSVVGGNLSAFNVEAQCQINDDDIQAIPTFLGGTHVYEGDTTQVTVQLDQVEDEDVTLRLQTFPASAVSPDDYTHQVFDVTIPAGSTLATGPAGGILARNDALVEMDETFGVEIVSVLQGDIGDTSGVGIITIIDNTPAVIPNIESLSQEFGAENTPNENLVFGVNLDAVNQTPDPIVLEFDFQDDTATGGTDYNNTPVTATILPGHSFGYTDPVQILDDTVVEGTETFIVQYKSTLQGVIGDTSPQGTGRIIDNDIPAPDVYINDASGREGVDPDLVFEVFLNQQHSDPAGLPLQLVFEAVPLTASAPSDFTAGEYTVSIPDGQFEGSLSVPIADDLAVESPEDFRLQFVRTNSAHVVGDTSDTAIGQIFDNDTLPDIEILNANPVLEGTAVQFTARLTTAPAGSIELEFTPFASGSATATLDYNPNPIRHVFTDENLVLLPPISTVDDGAAESTEYFGLQVSQVLSGASLIDDTTDTATATIIDDDTAAASPDLLILDADPVDEGGEVVFKLAVTQPVTIDTTINLRAVNGGAINGADFNVSGFIQAFIPAGRGPSDAPIEVRLPSGNGIPTIVDSNNLENDEDFTLEFNSHISGTTFADTSDIGTAIIRNINNSPSLSIDDSVGTEGQQAVFNVQLSRADHSGLEIDFKTSDASAVDPADYTCPALKLIFAPGEDRKQISCDLNADQINEPLETFALSVDRVVTGSLALGGSNDVGRGIIKNVQVVDVIVPDASLVYENVISGHSQFPVLIQGIPATDALEAPTDVTLTPEDLEAIGGISFALPDIDFNNTPLNLRFNPGKGLGSTLAYVQIPINNDGIIEVNPLASTFPPNRQERFRLNTNGLNSSNVRAFSPGQGTIQDEDSSSCSDKARVAVRDAWIVEGGDMVFDISLDRTLCSGSVDLTFRTVPGSATTADYQDNTYTVSIPAQKRRPALGNELRVPTIQDLLDEGNELFELEFVSANPPTYVDRVERKTERSDGSLQDLGTIPAVGTIVDNDTTLPTPVDPDLIIEDTSATEGSPLDFLIRLSAPALTDTDLLLATSNNTASAGTDFQLGAVTASILAGEAAGLVSINTIDDALVENDENLFLSFTSLLNGSIGNSSDIGTGTIVDNDTPNILPEVLIDDASAQEDASSITFALRLADPATKAPIVAPSGGLSFTVQPVDLTATNNQDYVGTTKTVTVPAGTTQRTFSFNLIDDTNVEGDEEFTVVVTGVDKPAEVDNFNDTGTGTIIDNEGVSCSALPASSQYCCLFPSACLSTVDPPGVDIEGQIIVDTALCSGEACNSTDTEAIVLGSNKLGIDIREEITRNAYSLIRGLTAANEEPVFPDNTTGVEKIFADTTFVNSRGKTIPRIDIYLDDLPDGGVTYLNRHNFPNYRIGSHRDGTIATPANPVVMSGTHTIIIEDATLNIVGDITYAGPNDSLGVIVLNGNLANLHNTTSRGQLTIHNKVKSFVGAYFTDGSFVSNWAVNAGNGTGRIASALDSNPANDWDITNGPALGKQLVLTGNLISRNTLGAADLIPPKDPWGKVLTGPEAIAMAQMFDLNYIRRYVPTFDPLNPTVQTNAADCTILPGDTQCYKNTKSFVIRIDPRLKENPPPGFEVQAMTKLQ